MMEVSSGKDSGAHGRRRRSSLLEDVQQKLHSHFMSTMALCSSVLTMFYLVMSVFPYSGFMSIHLVPGADHENAGLYAGFLTSSFMVGRALSAYPFGILADIYGRKFVLVLSLTVSAVGSIAFGYSTTYAMALTVRFLMGLGNGIMVVARTAISELAKGDKEMESKGVGVLMSMVGYGMLISPAIGGWLSEPLKQYPDADILGGRFDETLADFPFLLPNLIACIMASMSTLFVILSVEETLPIENRRHWGYAGSDLLRWFCGRCRVCIPSSSSTTTTTTSSNDDDVTTRVSISSENVDDWEDDLKILDSQEFIVASTLVSTENARASFTSALRRTSTGSYVSGGGDQNRNKYTQPNETTPLNPKGAGSEKEKENSSSSIKDIMSRKDTRTFLIAYWANTLASVSQSEAFPLFAMSKLGGLGLEESSIGLVGTIAGCLYCFAQYIIFTAAMKRFGLVRALQYGAFWANLPVILIPVSLYLEGWSQILYLSTISGVTMVSNSVFAGCCTIGANRTVEATQRAGMNGLTSLGTSVGRGSGPIFAGFLVTFAMTPGVLPPEFGGWVVYVVLTIIGMLSFVVTLSIPDEVE